MEPGELYWARVDSVWDAISIYDGSDNFLRQFAEVSPDAGALFAAHWCQSEVRNGGFHQFFWNSTGVLAPEAATAFELIGMPSTASVIRRAMAWFGPTYPRERKERQDALELVAGDASGKQDPFEDLDDTVFDCLDHENGGFDAAADQFAETSNG